MNLAVRQKINSLQKELQNKESEFQKQEGYHEHDYTRYYIRLIKNELILAEKYLDFILKNPAEIHEYSDKLDWELKSIENRIRNLRLIIP
jgi:hypothetical protein